MFVRIIKLGVFALFFALFITACATYIKTTAKFDDQPNIVLIIGDDHGYADLSGRQVLGDVATPHLDALANRGVNFTQAYATSPICNTSRAGLITGSYSQRFGAYWYGGKGIYKPEFPTIAEALQTKGYATGYIGKFHYGRDHGPGHRNFPNNHGFESFYGFAGGRKHYLIHSAAAQRAFRNTPKKYQTRGESLEMGPVWVNRTQVDQQGFSTELIGQRARDFIDRHPDQPFFLQVAFNAVHNFTHQLPEPYLKEKGLKGYHDWNPAEEDFREWYRNGRYPNNPEGRAHYLGQLYYLDREIGKLQKHLQKAGLSENTIIVYVGDNGGSTPIYANNSPLRGSKYTLYEGGIRVPLIIAGPDYVSAKNLHTVVSAMDIYPTVLQAAGVDLPDHIDGLDLTSQLNGDDYVGGDRILFWDTGHEIAVRDGKWKYRAAFDDFYAIRQGVDLELGEFLYDLEVDPGESVNLIDIYPDIAENLKSAYRRWRKNNEPDPASRQLKKQYLAEIVKEEQ